MKNRLFTGLLFKEVTQ